MAFPARPERPRNGNHALLVGNICGQLMQMETDLEIVLMPNQIDYSDTIIVKRPSGRYAIKITPIQEDEDAGTQAA